MKGFLILLLFAFSLVSYSQSTFFYELEGENTFKDAVRQLSDDTSVSPLIDLIDNEKSLSLYPVMELSYSIDNKEKGIFRAGAGAQLNYSSNKLNAGFTYLFNRGEYMTYRKELINARSVIPASTSKQGISTIDAQFWDAFLSYTPNQTFDFEIGYGRKFIGSGHRSLLLSDLSSPYPYFKINTKFWKLNYTNLFSRQMNTYGVVGDQDLYRQKFTASHYLELELFKKLKIGLFETVIWQSDEGTYIRGFDPNYLNPVIFYRPVEFSVGSSDNVILGANIEYEFISNYTFYFQALIDEFLLDEIRADVSQVVNEDEDIQSGWWGNKYGIQVGLKANDFLGKQGLMIRVEYNAVRPYTYAHSSPTQAYSHHSLPLAHPLGANFEEAIAQLRYSRSDWSFSAQYNQSRRGVSPFGTNFGEEIELSNTSRIKEYENFIGQGISTHTKYFEGSISRRLKFLWGADLSIGYAWRQQEAMDVVDVNTMVYLSIRSNLFRRAFDY